MYKERTCLYMILSSLKHLQKRLWLSFMWLCNCPPGDPGTYNRLSYWKGYSGALPYLKRFDSYREAFHLGLDLGIVPVQISRDKSHNYRAFGPILALPTPSK